MDSDIPKRRKPSDLDKINIRKGIIDYVLNALSTNGVVYNFTNNRSYIDKMILLEESLNVNMYSLLLRKEKKILKAIKEYYDEKDRTEWLYINELFAGEYGFDIPVWIDKSVEYDQFYYEQDVIKLVLFQTEEYLVTSDAINNIRTHIVRAHKLNNISVDIAITNLLKHIINQKFNEEFENIFTNKTSQN